MILPRNFVFYVCLRPCLYCVEIGLEGPHQSLRLDPTLQTGRLGNAKEDVSAYFGLKSASERIKLIWIMLLSFLIAFLLGPTLSYHFFLIQLMS